MRMTRREMVVAVLGAPIAALLGLRMHTPEIVGTLAGKDLVWPVDARPQWTRMVVTYPQLKVIGAATTPDIFTGPTIKWQTSMDGVYWRDSASLGTVVFR